MLAEHSGEVPTAQKSRQRRSEPHPGGARIRESYHLVSRDLFLKIHEENSFVFSLKITKNILLELIHRF